MIKHFSTKVFRRAQCLHQGKGLKLKSANLWSLTIEGVGGGEVSKPALVVGVGPTLKASSGI